MKLRPVARLVALVALLMPVLPALAGTPSIEVGSRAPKLELTGDDGTRYSLAGSQGPKVLVFYRGLW